MAKGGQAEATVLSLHENSRPILSLVNKVIRTVSKPKDMCLLSSPKVLTASKSPRWAMCELSSKIAHCLPSKLMAVRLVTMIKSPSCPTTSLATTSLQWLPPNQFLPTASATVCNSNHLKAATSMALVLLKLLNGRSNLITWFRNVPSSRPTSSRPLSTRPWLSMRMRSRQDLLQLQQVHCQNDEDGCQLWLDNFMVLQSIYVQAIGEGPLQHQPQTPGELDADEQDSRADPILNQIESQRRQDWLQIDPEIRKIVRDLPVNFGHPTSVTLQRILRRQGAKPEAIRAAGLLACDSCGEFIRRKRPRPVRLPNQYEFNRHLMMDTFYAKDIRGVTYGFLSIIDDATNFQVVACVGELQGPPASRAVLRHFTTSWSSWAGLPHSV